MMSLRSAPEWLWSAPERLSKQYFYRLVSVMKMMFPMIPYFLYMMSLRSAPEWLSECSGALRIGYDVAPERSGVVMERSGALRSDSVNSISIAWCQ